MAKGRPAFYLEGWKFSVYLFIPAVASWYFSDPARQKRTAEYWSYVKYPPNPNTNLREQIQTLQAQQEQRKAYQQQMRELQRQAERQYVEEEETAQNKGWFRWWRKNSTE